MRDLRVARVLFPANLLVFSLSVLPIAVAGLSVLPGAAAEANGFVLAPPLAAGNAPLTLLRTATSA